MMSSICVKSWPGNLPQILSSRPSREKTETCGQIPSITNCCRYRSSWKNSKTRRSSSPLPELPPLPPFLDSFSPLGFSTSSPSPSPIPSSTIPIPEPIPSTAPPPSNLHNLCATFHALLGFFDRTILLVFKSHYTQFLLFWYTSRDSDFSNIFQGMLIECALLDPSTPSVTRAAAASYIGSFVIRARFVKREGTRRVVGVLCDWFSAHVDDDHDAEVFYAISHSLFLMFCHVEFTQ
ncbi:RRN3-domain-containing protein [Hymenopellis radicata]|nr:RRN3-domain-containing protein [Hymenopellis radicata]